MNSGGGDGNTPSRCGQNDFSGFSVVARYPACARTSSSGRPSAQESHHQRDRLCGFPAEPTKSEPGCANEQRDAAILASGQETAASSSPCRLRKDGKLSSDDTITSERGTIVAARPRMRLCDDALASTHVPLARSAIGCATSPARCSKLTPHGMAKKALADGWESRL
jgi:hypothetical protein